MVENSHNQAGYSLPSEFLSDQNHSLPASDNHQLPTEFPYDFASFTCPPDEEEDGLFTGLTRQFALSTLLDSNKLQYAAASQTQKKWSLSSSPQSILSPVFINGSPTGPFQGPSSPTDPFASTDHSWDLIRKAAGQVNMWTKLKNQNPITTRGALLCSANNFTQPHSSSPHPCLYNDNHLKRNSGSIWAGPQACQKGPRYGVETGCGFGPNARCGNPHGLFHVNGYVSDHRSLFSGGRKNIPGSGCGGVKRKCAGTGVFLPRRCPEPVESRVKSGAASITQQRAAAQAMNMNYDRLMNHVEAQQCFLDGAGAGAAGDVMGLMAVRRNAALAQQWRNGMKMMSDANKAMNYDTHFPNEWSY